MKLITTALVIYIVYNFNKNLKFQQHYINICVNSEKNDTKHKNVEFKINPVLWRFIKSHTRTNHIFHSSLCRERVYITNLPLRHQSKTRNADLYNFSLDCSFRCIYFYTMKSIFLNFCPNKCLFP